MTSSVSLDKPSFLSAPLGHAILSKMSSQAITDQYKQLLQEEKEKPGSQQEALFDIEDHILRKSHDDIATRRQYQTLLNDTSFKTKLDALDATGSRFFSLQPKNAKKTSRIADYTLNPQQVAEAKPSQALKKVLKIAVENKRNPVGGISAVLGGLRYAHMMLGGEKVYSIHPLYSKDKEQARNLVFQGVITHQYEGLIVHSAIYKNKQDREYLVAPDPRFHKIFDIPKNSSIYTSTVESSINDRTVYLSSAAAAFAGLYKGKAGNNLIDVVQADDSGVGGLTFPLIKDVYYPMRKQAHLSIPKTVQVVHDGNLHMSSPTCSFTLDKMGVNKSLKKSGYTTELLLKSVQLADSVVFVSSELASRAITPDSRISGHFDTKLFPRSKVTPIRNGVLTTDFDVTNPDVFKEFTLQRTFSSDGIEQTDYVTYRKELKQKLFKAGVIADPDLPLVAYIGRYAHEKGIDSLTHMIKKADLGLAQFVTMGVNYGQDYYLDQLHHLASTSHKNNLRVYTQLSDQKALFKDNDRTYNVTVAQLVRAAADAFIVPSHAEACGLVPMEALCSGAFVIAPLHQGLKEICIPANADRTLHNDANAFCYDNHANYQEASAALSTALDTWNSISNTDRNKIAQRLRNYAIPNYSWFFKDNLNNNITGAVVNYHELYQKLTGKQSIPLKTNFTLKPSLQMSVKPYPCTVWTLSEKINKWFQSVRDYFFILLFQLHLFGRRIINRFKSEAH